MTPIPESQQAALKPFAYAITYSDGNVDFYGSLPKFPLDKERGAKVVPLYDLVAAPVDHAALGYRERAMQIAEAYGGSNPQDKLLLASAIAKAFLGYERSISALRAHPAGGVSRSDD